MCFYNRPSTLCILELRLPATASCARRRLPSACMARLCSASAASSGSIAAWAPPSRGGRRSGRWLPRHGTAGVDGGAGSRLTSFTCTNVTQRALSITQLALSVTQLALIVTQRALSVTQRALSVTQRALSVTQLALSVTQRALSVTQEAVRYRFWRRWPPRRALMCRSSPVRAAHAGRLRHERRVRRFAPSRFQTRLLRQARHLRSPGKLG
jgi:hypothetical protein